MTLRDFIDQDPGLDLKAVADALGVTVNHVWRIKSGSSTPSASLARRIVEWTKGAVTFDDLFGGAEK